MNGNGMKITTHFPFPKTWVLPVELHSLSLSLIHALTYTSLYAAKELAKAVDPCS